MNTRALPLAMASLLGCGADSADNMPWVPGTAMSEDSSVAGSTGDDDADAQTAGDDGDAADDAAPTTSAGVDDGESGSVDTTGGDVDTGAEESTGQPPPPVDPPPFLPLYRVALRVHMTNSALTHDELLDYLNEMNFIWRSQAGICFEVEVVDHDDIMTSGYDLWFQPEVDGYNGYYYGDHQIYVRDYPSLNNAPNPAMFQGARTTAHELGHALTLAHDQNSDDYLMRSGTKGWQIPMNQITASRNRAEDKALADTTVEDCAPPQLP